MDDLLVMFLGGLVGLVLFVGYNLFLFWTFALSPAL